MKVLLNSARTSEQNFYNMIMLHHKNLVHWVFFENCKLESKKYNALTLFKVVMVLTYRN